MDRSNQLSDNTDMTHAERAIVAMLRAGLPNNPALLQYIEAIERGEHMRRRTVNSRQTVVMAKEHIAQLLRAVPDV